MDGLRKFLGLKDIEYVALHKVFPGSLAVLISPVSLEDRWPLIIQAPEHHINFLHPLMKRMLKDSPLSEEGGGWIGVNHPDATSLNLFYVYEDYVSSTLELTAKNARRIELLQSKFRNDAARYAGLMFSHVSVIEVAWEDKQVSMRGDVSLRVSLPPDFKNGSIVLPLVYLH